ATIAFLDGNPELQLPAVSLLFESGITSVAAGLLSDFGGKALRATELERMEATLRLTVTSWDLDRVLDENHLVLRGKQGPRRPNPPDVHVELLDCVAADLRRSFSTCWLFAYPQVGLDPARLSSALALDFSSSGSSVASASPRRTPASDGARSEQRSKDFIYH